jgi:hypothetical protein
MNAIFELKFVKYSGIDKAIRQTQHDFHCIKSIHTVKVTVIFPYKTEC